MTGALAFTVSRLTALCHARQRSIPAGIAAGYAAALEAVREAGGLTAAARVSQFIAQIATETGGFGALVERMKYRDPARLAHLFPTKVRRGGKAPWPCLDG
jgi:predicted chitinase